MKKIKVLFNGQHLRDIYPHATRWQVFKFRVRRFFRKMFITSMALTALYVAGLAGATFFPSESFAIKEVPIKDETPTAVLARIAKCESPNGQFGTNGQVQINATQDIGKYQINVPTWGKKATELGYNLAVEKDNEAMALWLYENKGTEPWASSKGCWNK